MDASKIGQDRAYPNPQDAIDAETGTYKDAGDSMSVEDKLPIKQLPKGPGPNPFGNLSSPASGSR